MSIKKDLLYFLDESFVFSRQSSRRGDFDSFSSGDQELMILVRDRPRNGGESHQLTCHGCPVGKCVPFLGPLDEDLETFEFFYRQPDSDNFGFQLSRFFFGHLWISHSMKILYISGSRRLYKKTCKNFLTSG